MTGIAVVIPTCNRPDTLAICLRALPSGAAIFVTDDSRDDRTREMIGWEFPTVQWIAGPKRGPAANRNHGARAADAEWIVFLDDDCIPQPGWLNALTAHLDADVIEGRTVCPDASDDPFCEFVENLNGDNFWSCNLAIRRSVLERLGGFDEDFTESAGEDMELATRIRKGGLRTVFAPGATVHHPARRGSWKLLWRRTCMQRWMALYRLKTGDSPPLQSGRIHITWSFLLRESVELLRLTKQAVTRPDPVRPRSQRFHLLRQWIAFPIILPWLLAWEFRFRRQISGRRSV